MYVDLANYSFALSVYANIIIMFVKGLVLNDILLVKDHCNTLTVLNSDLIVKWPIFTHTNFGTWPAKHIFLFCAHTLAY